MVDASNSDCRQEESSNCLSKCELLAQAKIPNQNNSAKFTKNSSELNLFQTILLLYHFLLLDQF